MPEVELEWEEAADSEVELEWEAAADSEVGADYKRTFINKRVAG